MVRQLLSGSEHMDNHASQRMHPKNYQGFCFSCVRSRGNSILACQQNVQIIQNTLKLKLNLQAFS